MDNFISIAIKCGCSGDEIKRLESGESVISYRFIPTFEELVNVFSRANDRIRKHRAKVFYDAPNVLVRQRIGQGIHDRLEKILFSYGEPISEFDLEGMKRHQPHPVKFYSVRKMTVKPEECFDFSATANDFGLWPGDDLLCCINIGTLILEEGARVCVKGNLLSLSCQKIIKKGNSAEDILVLPTEFSYSSDYVACNKNFNGSRGANGENGNNGESRYTPPLSNSILGLFHFGEERGIKNGDDGGNGGNGHQGEKGLCGGATKIAEIFINDIELLGSRPLCIKGKAGDGGRGGGAGGAYRVYTDSGEILSFEKGIPGSGGNGGDGGKGGNGGNGGISSNIFVEVPSKLRDKIVCVSEAGKGGSGGNGGKGGKGGDGANGEKITINIPKSYDRDHVLISSQIAGPGKGGAGGLGGPGGKAGIHGDAASKHSNEGSDGRHGENGKPGENGEDGSVSGMPGEVEIYNVN